MNSLDFYNGLSFLKRKNLYDKTSYSFIYTNEDFEEILGSHKTDRIHRKLSI